MKRYLILAFFLLLGCTSTSKYVGETTCPNVLFSSEHRNYIYGNSSPITFDNLSYRAEINNYHFDKACKLTEKFLEIKLSILFIVNPENPEKDKIILPYYLALLNEEDNIIDMHYFQIEDIMKLDLEQNIYLETEIKDIIKLNIELDKIDINSEYKFVIGFMLDKEKLKLLS